MGVEGGARVLHGTSAAVKKPNGERQWRKGGVKRKGLRLRSLSLVGEESEFDDGTLPQGRAVRGTGDGEGEDGDAHLGGSATVGREKQVEPRRGDAAGSPHLYTLCGVRITQEVYAALPLDAAVVVSPTGLPFSFFPWYMACTGTLEVTAGFE
jgi:hypothetical protein